MIFCEWYICSWSRIELYDNCSLNFLFLIYNAPNVEFLYFLLYWMVKRHIQKVTALLFIIAIPSLTYHLLPCNMTCRVFKAVMLWPRTLHPWRRYYFPIPTSTVSLFCSLPIPGCSFLIWLGSPPIFGGIRVGHLSFQCCVFVFVLVVFFLCLAYPILSVSLDCQYIAAPSDFSNVY